MMYLVRLWIVVFSARKTYFALIFINMNIVRAKNK